jgi:hypothetical protein
VEAAQQAQDYLSADAQLVITISIPLVYTTSANHSSSTRLKDSDVTWLYGPLFNSVSPVPTSKVATTRQTQHHSPSPKGKKPILKRRTLAEVLVRGLSKAAAQHTFPTPTRLARSTLFRLLCQRTRAQTGSPYSVQRRIQICSTPLGSPSPQTKMPPLLDSTPNPPSVSHVRGSTHPHISTAHLVRPGQLVSDISASTPSSHSALPSSRASTSQVCSMRRKTRQIAHRLIGRRPSLSPRASRTTADRPSRAPTATRPTCQSGSRSHPSHRQCSSSKTRIRRTMIVGL